MGLLIFCGLFVLSFLICTIYIRSKWKKYANNMFGVQLLRQYNVLSRVWPSDDGFASLIFSALRHTLVPLVSAVLIWLVNITVLNKILMALVALYSLSIYYPRHVARRADYKSASELCQKILKPVKSACFSVIICAIVNYLILICCYGFRPY